LTEQHEIIEALGVRPEFDAALEAQRRIDFLATYLRASGLTSYVLGISGGVDSLAAAMLAQRAVRQLREARHDASFIAVRLPYGVQADESDAQRAIDTIGADQVLTVDIKPAADAMLAALKAGGLAMGDAGREDFLLGNIKARQRMIAQFAIAGATRGLVIGTDHAAEALMGFFTKFGDGAADILPLSGLNKRRVRALAAHLGAPADLVAKVPTADLENLVPLRPDEDAYGVTYEQIDDFLEGRQIDEAARARILQVHAATAHKRTMPVVPEG
jgi:NAD+ synthase